VLRFELCEYTLFRHCNICYSVVVASVYDLSRAHTAWLSLCGVPGASFCSADLQLPLHVSLRPRSCRQNDGARVRPLHQRQVGLSSIFLRRYGTRISFHVIVKTASRLK